MGKLKKKNKGTRLCETGNLHTEDTVASDFEHHSRVRADIKHLLLAKVGKRKFKGAICKACRDLVSSQYATNPLINVTPGDIGQLENVSLFDNLDLSEVSGIEEMCIDIENALVSDAPADTTVTNENEAQNTLETCVLPTNEEIMQNVFENRDVDQDNIQSTDKCNLQSCVCSSCQNRNEDLIVLRVSNLRQDLKSLPQSKRDILAFELAQAEKEEIRKDTSALSRKECRELSLLGQICNKDYLLARNKVLLMFLLGLWTEDRPSNIDLTTIVLKSTIIYKLAKVIEACMSLTRTRVILPIHFRELILVYSHTRSRTALMLMSCAMPCGSYQTARIWLDELAESNSNTNPCADKGDYVGVFDNNQVFQRRWNISTDKQAVCNIITMVMYLEIDVKGVVQFQEGLKPGTWMWHNLDVAALTRLRKGHRDLLCQRTRYYRHYKPWLARILSEVVREQSLLEGQHSDEIDQAVAQGKLAKTTKVCSNCSLEFPISKRKCTQCKLPLKSRKPSENTSGKQKAKPKKQKPLGEIEVFVDQIDDQKWTIRYEKEPEVRKTEYDDIPPQHPAEPPRVIVGEPLFRNPCSYEAVAQVFRDIGKAAGIKQYGGKREWICLTCDGLPYLLGYQIIERCYICAFCDTPVQGSAELKAHKEFHFGACHFYQEFSWILLQPGPGHVEMNMIRSFVKFAWPIFWERMVEVFNFVSEIAKRSAYSVSDHHKGMTLAKIAREAFAKELVLPYVREMMCEENTQVSVEGFMKYTLGPDRSANYALMIEVLSILDAIFLYRKGLRTGDTDLIDSGRTYYGRMWSARNHPIYRQLHAYDNIMAASMPLQVTRFIKKTKSFNLSGIPYTGEGADFKMEEVNRNVQHWLPSVPTEKDWRNACLNHQQLDELKKQTTSDVELKDASNSITRPEKVITGQANAFRVIIRESGFLLDSNRHELTSITKRPLDPGLVNFTDKAAEKEAKFLEIFLEHKKADNFMNKRSIPFNEDPIFVLPEERTEYEDINNKSLNDLKHLIETKIAEIPNWEMRTNYKVVWKRETLPTKNRDEFIQFYNMLVDYENIESDDEVDSDFDIEEEENESESHP